MKTIFIIRAISSDYDVHDWPVGWVETEDEAIENTKHMNEVCELAEKYKSLIREYHLSIIDTTPKEEMEKVPEYPRWPAGIPQKLITKEMRDERERIKKEAMEIQKRNDEKSKKFYDLINKSIREYKDTLNLSKNILEEMDVDYVRGYDWFELKKL